MALSYVLLDDQISGQVRRYENPVSVITAHIPDEVNPAFDAIIQAQQDGYYLAGHVAYELGYVLESKLGPLMPDSRSVPLIHMGVFEDFKTVELQPTSKVPQLSFRPDWSMTEYAARFDRVQAYIQAGDVYQVNLTFPMWADYDGEADALYRHLRDRQPGRYGGVVSLGGPDIISLSPELFFDKRGDNITMRPMKGTARRMADPVQDEALRDAMQKDMKSRAENLMIVDLLRNDLSRLARRGGVSVPELFALETYPTLHQMTSRVTARLRGDVSVQDIFKSLFPCGSVTGAPKIRAVEIIRELEDHPRGAYCGGLGYIEPNGDICFSVAIRTLTLDDGKLTYNVGSGVVLDSVAQDEYEECLLKAKVVQDDRPELIETMRWVPSEGYLRGDRHVARLLRSAESLGYPARRSQIMGKLAEVNADVPQRVRLTLNPEGHLHLECRDFEPVLHGWRLALSKNPLVPEIQECRHKVSHRNFYDGERRRIQGLVDCDEVLFVNDAGELCEGSFTNLFIETHGQLLTPDLACGLLPGILREELLATGQARPARLKPSELTAATDIYVGNSLRGLIKCQLISLEAF